MEPEWKQILHSDDTLDRLIDDNRAKIVEAGAAPEFVAAYDGIAGLLVEIALSLSAIEKKLDA